VLNLLLTTELGGPLVLLYLFDVAGINGLAHAGTSCGISRAAFSASTPDFTALAV
jgi:hypothetical protein